MLMMRAATLAANQQEVDPMWLLCDNKSTVDVINNTKKLTDIRKARKPIQLKGTGAHDGIAVNQEGD